MKLVLQISNYDTVGGIFRVLKDLDRLFIDDADFKMNFLTIKSAYNFNNTISNLFFVPAGTIKKIAFLYKSINTFDILHFHGFNLIMIILSFFSTSRIVFTNHGLLGTGRKLKHYEHLKKRMLIYFLRKRADKIINVSEYALRRILNEYKINREKLCVIYNSSDFELSANNLISHKETYTVGFHGRFVGFKRVDRLFGTVKLLNDKYKLRTDVLLIGEGPLAKHYRSISDQLGLSTHIAEYTPNPEKELEKVDFLIIPSDEEYFGLSVIEGIRFGIPTFVFKDGGGCTEIFDLDNDWFVCNDEDDMASKILFCVENPDVVRSKFANLQDHVARTFSEEKFYENYKKCYTSLFN